MVYRGWGGGDEFSPVDQSRGGAEGCRRQRHSVQPSTSPLPILPLVTPHPSPLDPHTDQSPTMTHASIARPVERVDSMPSAAQAMPSIPPSVLPM